MGWQLREHVERHAPKSLTPRERLVLGILAQIVWDKVVLAGDPAEIRPFTEDVQPDLLVRANLSRSQLYVAVKALCDKDSLEKLRGGNKGRQAIYIVPLFGVELRPEIRDATQLELSPEIRDATTGVASRKKTNSVPNSGTRNQSHEKPTTTREAVTQPPLTTYVVSGEGEGSKSNDDPTVDRLVAAAASSLAAVDADRMTGSQAAELRMSLQAALVLGWTVDELRAVVSRSLRGSDHPFRVLRSNVKAKAAEPPATLSAAAPVAESAPWCGHCEADAYRFRRTDRGDQPCTDCHPSQTHHREDTIQEATA